MKKFTFILAFGWLVFVSILFFLPGSAFPKEDWFSKIYFDKWVHIGIFTVLVSLWSWVFELRYNKYVIVLFAAAVLYGYLVEVIQDQYISNRSFDWGDLLADSAGTILGLAGWFWMSKKNKPL